MAEEDWNDVLPELISFVHPNALYLVSIRKSFEFLKKIKIWNESHGRNLEEDV